MKNWNPVDYLAFGDERTRAASDLVNRIDLADPGVIVDLGCGPGNSTQVLRRRWPRSRVQGVDQSIEMIESARRQYPGQDWTVADISNWRPAEPTHLLYANAALQWLPNHEALMPRLFTFIAPNGALAFQIPSSTFAKVRTLIHAISEFPRWTNRMDDARRALTMNPPQSYYDALVTESTKLDIWETEYYHIMESHQAIIDWISSTGLRPFLSALEHDDERNAFVAQLREDVIKAYPQQVDKKVLFPFRRTFVIAYR